MLSKHYLLWGIVVAIHSCTVPKYINNEMCSAIVRDHMQVEIYVDQNFKYLVEGSSTYSASKNDLSLKENENRLTRVKVRSYRNFNRLFQCKKNRPRLRMTTGDDDCITATLQFRAFRGGFPCKANFETETWDLRFIYSEVSGSYELEDLKLNSNQERTLREAMSKTSSFFAGKATDNADSILYITKDMKPRLVCKQRY